MVALTKPDLRPLCRCGAPTAGTRLCGDCSRRMVERARELREQRKAAGLCRCGRKMMAGRRRCGKCAERRRQRAKRDRDTARRLGVCRQCSRPVHGTTRWCQEHLVKHNAHTLRSRTKRRAWLKQDALDEFFECFDDTWFRMGVVPMVLPVEG